MKNYKGHPQVEPALSMNVNYQDSIIAQFRWCAVKQFNLGVIKERGTYYMRERKGKKVDNNINVCLRFKGFLP